MSEDQTPHPRLSGRLRLLLALSLGLNLLVIGAVVGAMLGPHDWRGHDRHGMRAMAGGPLTRALDHADRRAIGREMRAARNEAGLDRAARREGMQAILTELRRVPFDPEALSVQLSEQRRRLHSQVALGQTLLIERLTQMSDAERAAFADRVEQYRRPAR